MRNWPQLNGLLRRELQGVVDVDRFLQGDPAQEVDVDADVSNFFITFATHALALAGLRKLCACGPLMLPVQLGSALHVEWALPPSVGSPAPVSRVLHVSRLPLTCAYESGENDVDESVPGSALFLRCMFEPYGQLTRVKVGKNGGSGEGVHPH